MQTPCEEFAVRPVEDPIDRASRLTHALIDALEDAANCTTGHTRSEVRIAEAIARTLADQLDALPRSRAA